LDVDLLAVGQSRVAGIDERQIDASTAIDCVALCTILSVQNVVTRTAD
jgi:hypothetical protein